MKNKKLTTEEFINKSIQIHDNKYDYSKVEYINNHTKVCIICPEHGEFWQRPADHINSIQGCPICKKTILSVKFSMGKIVFVEKSKKAHGDKYDYSKVEYINNKTKVCIICPIHGEFYQKPDKHLNGQGCPKCSNGNIGNVNKAHNCALLFSEKAKKVHDIKYDYSKVEYKNSNTKVCIICPEHGEFWQLPSSHLQGQNCPKCCGIPILEKNVMGLLKEKNIQYIEQKSFEWLKGKMKSQRLDFYLLDYNIAIECQGEQHFKPVKYFGGCKKFKYTKYNDLNKFMLCKSNNIDILYYSNNKIIPNEFNDYNVITDLNVLYDAIIKYKKIIK